ncbi:MAG: tetratricopeptide repeat protein [Candidatus Omnitrophica bacterium]|nr:tetratricopeptide repeat protein [Candidatus Omnitrophota bacterium]
MAVIYDNFGQMDDAIQEYRRVLEIDKNSAVIHINLATTFLKNNDAPSAIKELKLVEEIDPEAPEPHAILALIYASQNKTDLATYEYQVALEKAAKLQPKNIDIYKNLGLVYLGQKRFKDAHNCFRLVTDISPENAESHFYLGYIYSELKNNSLAEKELKEAIRLNPNYAAALNFLGYLYVDQNKNLQQAGEMIQKALEIEPNNGAYVDSLGWLYFRKGEFQEALKHLERASTLLPDPAIYDHLGDVYFKLNDSVKAKLNWEESLKLDPQQEKIKEKIRKLKIR